MTAVENLSPPHPLPAPPPASAVDDELYHSDDVGLRDTPPLEPKKVRLQPSPSPPLAIPSPEVTPDSSPDPPDRKRPQRDSNRRRYRNSYRPSQGDAVLIHFMGGGKNPDIAGHAGQEPLAGDDEEDDGHDSHRGATVVDDVEKGVHQPSLAAIAQGALAQHGQTAQELAATRQSQDNAAQRVVGGERIDEIRPSIPSIASAYAGDARRPPSPDASLKQEVRTPSTGGLPPIRQHSPQSHLANGNGTGPITLPSITAQLGDLSHLTDVAAAGDAPFPQSPPPRPPHRYSGPPNHGSPPKSPNDAFRRGLPSPSGPGHYYYTQGNHQRVAQPDGTQYASSGDYSSSNTETPSTDQSAPTPAPAIDRMSIDGITNPQVGGYQCTYPGCTAQPFQTQYLLNSHANVHSSIRPHYCPVKGCPRSEGGKGFKRKNEMIRHGLVHDSPGYVCPFCPDREHKYPRPDNLQRHVRVHHVDRDKDDPQLRDVLAQRAEGPSRGRRRRGAAPS